MMKKIFTTGLLLISFLSVTDHLFSAAVYQNENQSAEFVRTLNRNASTDVDAAYYNPAGLAMMNRDGLFFALSDQMIFQRRRIEDSSPDIKQYIGNGSEVAYEGDAFTWGFPDGYIVYKQDKGAFFAHFGFLGAGVSATFENGLPGFDTLGIIYSTLTLASYGDTLKTYNADTKINVYSLVLGSTIGGAYALNDKVSFGAGFRYLYGLQQFKMRMNFQDIEGNSTSWDILKSSGRFDNVIVDVDAEGHSFGCIAGIDIRPTKDLNIGIKYEYYLPLTLTNKVPWNYQVPAGMLAIPQMKQQFSKFEEGAETKRSLPSNAALGVSSNVLPVLRVELGFTYYFNKYADWDRDINDNRKMEDKFDNGYTFGVAFEYIGVQNLKASAGTTYSRSGRTKSARNEFEFDPDSNAFACGATYSFTENTDFTVGMMYVSFHTEEGTSTPVIGQYQTVSMPYTVGIIMGVTYKAI